MNRPAQQPARTGRNQRRKARTPLTLERLEDRTLLTGAGPAPAPGAYDPTQILVQFRPESLAGAAPVVKVPGAVLGQALAAVPGLYDVRLNGLSVAAALALFQADPRVQSAEPDYYVQAAGTPNDPQFGGQWGLLNTGQSGGTAGVDVKATQAWNVVTGSPGVVVAQIDTGVDYNHPDLYQNIWINQAEIPDQWFTKASPGSSEFTKVVNKSQIKTATAGIITFADLNNPANAGLVWDGNGDGRIDAGDLLRPLSQGGWASGSTKDGDKAHPDDFFGWNFVSNTNNPFDDNGHGTNVAGVMAAAGNNGATVAGVDWQMQLQELKVFAANGASTIAEIVAAIGYSVQHGAKISNNSWSYLGPDDSLYNAIVNAQNAGQIFVVAAGNEANSQPDYPAMFDSKLTNIVAVTAIDRAGNLWSSSNYGATTVTLAAPGVDVLSTAPNGGTSTYTGTSQATPFVTGVLALVWGQHPTWTYQQVIHQVTSTTTPLASLQGKTITGGIVNAAAAVGATANGGGNPTPPPVTPHATAAAFSGPDAYSLNKILVTFDQVMNAATFTSANVHLTNPSGQAVSLTLGLAPGSDGHQFEIDFVTQTAPGTYVLAIGSGVQDRQGDALAPYSVAYSVAAAPAVYASTQTWAIPGGGSALATVKVNQNVVVGSLQVTLNITFPYDGALFIHLQSPDGTNVLLVNQEGGSGRNFTNTVLADNGRTSIRLGSAPFTGTFQAESPLSTFVGKNASGVWKLWVENRSTGYSGVVNSWSLTITPQASTTAKAAGSPRIASGPPAAGSPPTGTLVSGTPAAGPSPSPNGISHDRMAVVDAVFLSGDESRREHTSLIPAWWSFLTNRPTRPEVGIDPFGG